MKKRPVFDDRDWEVFCARLDSMTKPEACAAVLGGPANEAAVFRDAALRVLFATSLYHQTQAHETPSCIGCDEEECVAGIAAAAAFKEEVQLRAYRRPRLVPDTGPAVSE